MIVADFRFAALCSLCLGVSFEKSASDSPSSDAVQMLFFSEDAVDEMFCSFCEQDKNSREKKNALIN